jgi:hypothetical protein
MGEKLEEDNFANINCGHCCPFGCTKKSTFGLFFLMLIGVNGPVSAVLSRGVRVT